MKTLGENRKKNHDPAEADFRETILVVDDDAGILDSCKTTLEYSGYQVLLAKDGFEAVDLFRKSSDSISCVLLDLRMPEKPGEDVYQELREINPEVPVVLFTAHCDDQSIQHLVKEGVVGIVPKPYSYSELMATLDEVLF
jgi:DNA-binding NtrC family response regulator